MIAAAIFKPSGRIRTVALLAALIVTIIAFLPSLGNGFLKWDDASYVLGNPDIRGFSPGKIAKIFTSFSVSNYQPLTMVTYAVDYRLFGLNPAAYHSTNLILHLANCGLVFWLVLMLGGRTLSAFFACLVFGIHPLHVESVAWIAERKDVLYCFFFLAALVAYVSYLKGKGGPKYYFFAFILYVAAALSKAMAVSLPLVLFALDYLLHRKLSPRSVIEKVPFLAVAVVVGAVAVYAQKASGALTTGIFKDQIVIASAAIIFYLRKFVIPLRLSCFYQWPNNSIKLLPYSFLIAPYIVAALGAAVVFFARYSRKILFGALFFLFTILPVLQIVPVGNTMVADRYIYLPMFGILYVSGEMLSRLVEEKARWAFPVKILITAVLTLMTVALATLTWQRCEVWRDNTTLFTDAIASYPRSYLAYINRGVTYLDKGEYRMAVSDFKKAVILKPSHSYAYINLSNLYNKLGENEKAVLCARRAIRLSPASAIAYYNLGNALLDLGRNEKAIAAYEKAVEFKKNYLDAYYNLGTAYAAIGRNDDAARLFKKVLQADPGYADAYCGLAEICAERKEYEAAAVCCERAIELGSKPDQSLLVTLKPYLAGARRRGSK
ncbi:MAG: tetratricopeptide repeat protein [Candidatus Omnitrophota bacterium]